MATRARPPPTNRQVGDSTTTQTSNPLAARLRSLHVAEPRWCDRDAERYVADVNRRHDVRHSRADQPGIDHRDGAVSTVAHVGEAVGCDRHAERVEAHGNGSNNGGRGALDGATRVDHCYGVAGSNGYVDEVAVRREGDSFGRTSDRNRRRHRDVGISVDHGNIMRFDVRHEGQRRLADRFLPI